MFEYAGPIECLSGRQSRRKEPLRSSHTFGFQTANATVDPAQLRISVANRF